MKTENIGSDLAEVCMTAYECYNGSREQKLLELRVLLDKVFEVMCKKSAE